ncbi:MAG: F0F1 ATP synthase subunit A [Candidatus Hydrogenedens sp.]|jgi:F-type H+-transporting ATPase subunit a|nr:F0F1 ATP synthase subunit A [Candidatus Hydrogenedens sp.]
MEDLGQRLVWHYIPFTDLLIPFGGINIITVINTVFVFFVALLLIWWGTRKIDLIPGRSQVLFEFMIQIFRNMLEPAAGDTHQRVARRALPVVMSLFYFILVSNAIVLLPIPHLEEPTGDLNCTFALAVVAVTYSVLASIRAHGVKGTFAEFCGPLWHQPDKSGWDALPAKLSGLFFFPLRIIEEVSRMISLSCRLFGNIFGVAIVIIVVSSISYYVLMPLALYGVLVIFEAGLQAFVFATLTVTYLSSAINPN